MYWINIDTLKSNDASASHSSNTKPTNRWGQACVNANNRLYIIGGYEGNYSLTKIKYSFSF
jgi:hypothetical protein